MKANELMIGDWVVYRGDTEYTNPIRIEGMDILIHALITEDREDVGFDGIEPIPLTAEILEKNGFVEHRDGFYATEQEQLAGDGFIVRNMVYYKSGILSVVTERGEIGIGIKFIHELQHAFRLCGIEKEIKL